MKLAPLLPGVLLCVLCARGQTPEVRLRILSDSRTPVSGAIVTLTPIADTNHVVRTLTDTSGQASFTLLPQGVYRCDVLHVGHVPYRTLVHVTDTLASPSAIVLRTRTIPIGEVVVRADPPLLQRGDTTEYRADAFLRDENATAEDLLKLLPGLTFSGGVIRSGLEEVSQILVDGRPFMTNDPSAVLQALPAGQIERIQVFDAVSDMAEFTGFEDGDTRRTINIVTRRNLPPSMFGRLEALYGESGRYQVQGSIGRRAPSQRYFIMGRTGTRTGSGAATTLATAEWRGRDGEGSSPAERSEGFATWTNAQFLNGVFDETWSDGSGFLTYTANRTADDKTGSRLRTFLLAEETGSVYRENTAEESDRTSHSVTGRLQIGFDSLTSILVSPRLTLQDGDASRTLTGSRTFADQSRTSTTFTGNRSGTTGSNLGGTAMLRRKFTLPGRTVALEAGATRQRTTRTSSLSSLSSTLQDTFLLGDTLVQRGDDARTQENVSVRTVYTEPVAINSRLQLEYSLARTHSVADTRTFTSGEGPEAGYPDPRFSQSYAQDQVSQRGGIAYQLFLDDSRITLGLSYDVTRIEGDQTFPALRAAERSYRTLLPSIAIRYTFTRSTNMRLSYRTVPRLPTISQLQDVVDNTNPLLQTTGNPDLRQAVVHSVNGRVMAGGSDAWHIFAHGSCDIADDYIGTATTVFPRDTVFPGGVRILQGSELTRPVNLGGYWQATLQAGLGVSPGSPLVHCSFSSGASFSAVPWMRDGVTSSTRRWSVTPRVVVSVDLWKLLSMAAQYEYTHTSSSVADREGARGAVKGHAVVLYADVNLHERFRIQSQFWFQHRTEAGAGFERGAALWNLGVVGKLFANKRGEVRLEVYDLLNRDRSGVRTITERYIEDSAVGLLPRYVQVRFLYSWI